MKEDVCFSVAWFKATLSSRSGTVNPPLEMDRDRGENDSAKVEDRWSSGVGLRKSGLDAGEWLV